MKTVFVGAVMGSLRGLTALVESGQTPDLVVTLPPEKAERHSDFADIATPAREAGAQLYFTDNINNPQTLDDLRAFGPDLCLVIGWSQICRVPFLSIPSVGSIGFHPAPLPRMRGRAVIPWTILMDEKESGSSLFWLDEGTDSGPIVLQRRFPLADDETAASLYDKHTANLEAMLPEAVRLAAAGSAPSEEQDHTLATYCAKRTPGDGEIDWNLPAEMILRHIRAVGDPYPGAFTIADGETLFIDEASPVENSWRYVGLTGQVQAIGDRGFIVRCGDGRCIETASWRGSRKPKMHSVLGR